MYLYPHIHPSNAQCQVVINKPDLNLFPLLSNCKAYEVIMEPGDVLYLPPMVIVFPREMCVMCVCSGIIM